MKIEIKTTVDVPHADLWSANKKSLRREDFLDPAGEVFEAERFEQERVLQAGF